VTSFITPKSGALYKALSLQNAREELPFVVSVEDAERQVNELRLVDEQHKVVFPYRRAFDLIPFQGHPFARIFLHDDLLTGNLIGKFLEKNLSLIKLCNSIELDPPKEHVQAQASESTYEPPNAWNPDVAQTK
jgi:hypothetical protein